jgi:flagellar biosynthesis/type III secretory pathway protein FliH
MSERRCKQCRATFSGESWKTLCLDCWKTNKAKSVSKEIDQSYNRGFFDGYQEGSQEGLLDGPIIKDIIQLCHPDRQPPERADIANRVTAALNSIKESI